MHKKITDFSADDLESALDSLRNPFATQNQERHEKLVLDAATALADYLREVDTDVDPEPWVDDCFGGRWSGEKMNTYKAHGSSFTFSFEPRY